MADRTYVVESTGWDRRAYEVTITDTRESTGTTFLEAAEEFLGISGGEGDDTREPGMWPRELQLDVIQTAAVDPITSAAPRDLHTTVEDADTGALFWQGYLFPDQFQDAPLGPQPDTISLSGTEGTPLLGDISFSAVVDEDLGDPFQARVHEVLAALLKRMYSEHGQPTLDVVVGMESYPETSMLSGSDLPLYHTWINPDNYRESRPDSDAWQTCQDVLNDLLTTFGMTCKQVRFDGGLVWHVQEPSALGSGTTELWRLSYSSGSPSVSHLGQHDFTTDLGGFVDLNVELDHARTFERPKKDVEVVHDHPSDVNFLLDSSFERFGGGAQTGWTYGEDSTNHTLVQRRTHFGDSLTPEPTVGDQYYAQLYTDTTEEDEFSYPRYLLSQSVQTVASDPRGGLRLQWEGRYEEGAQIAVKIETADGAFLSDPTTKIRGGARPGAVALPVEPIANPIPKGAVLGVYESPTSYIDENFEATITLEERVEEGATQLIGELSAEAGIGGGDSYVYYPSWGGTEIPIHLGRFAAMDDRWEWGAKTLYMPSVDHNGNVIDGEITIKLGFGQNNQGDDERWLLDNIQLTPVREGQALDETVSVASVDTSGNSEERESRLGSGPSETSIARLFGSWDFNSRYEIVGVDTTNEEFIVDGDARGNLSSGDGFYTVKAGENSGFWEVDFVSYDSNTGNTTVRIPRNLYTDEAGGWLGVGLNDFFRAFWWGVGANPTETYPLGELQARRRLAHHRQPNTRLELTLLLDDSTPDLFGNEYVAIDGTGYTIEAIEATPSIGAGGTSRLTLLEHNDYGTA